MNKQEQIEYYHSTGQMPNWCYYQLNGKTAQENYISILKQRQKENEGFIFTVIKNSLQATLKQALNDIFKELKF